MGTVWSTLLVLLVFTLIGGFFAAAEVALVALRESQVQKLADSGTKRGDKVARLVADPNRFLAAVQVGVTFAGFLSAGFGASRLVPVLAPVLEEWGLPNGFSETVAFIGTTALIAYLSLVLGELVPKRLALQRNEAVALATAGPIDATAKIAKPFIALLSVSTNAVVRLLGLDPSQSREAMTGEELRGMVAAQESLSDVERAIIDEVFDVGQREISEVMIPRTEVDFLDASMPIAEAAKVAATLPHSRYPVIGATQDDVTGFVHIRDILDPIRVGRPQLLGEIAREVLRLPDSKHVLAALHDMRSRRVHIAIVVDEYGGTAGIVTMEDLVEELVGEIEDEFDQPEAVRIADGSTFSGLLRLNEFAERAGVTLPEGPYETVAGYVMTNLGRLPKSGDVVAAPDSTLEVVEMDGRRLAAVRVHANEAAPDNVVLVPHDDDRSSR